jgi:hypothetical protein
MADDLEAFLRQAAQRRAQKAAGAPQAPAAVQRPAPAAPPRTPASPQTARLSTRPAQSPTPTPNIVAAEVVPVEEVSRFRTRVDTSSIARHAGQLGEEVGLADEHMEEHLSKAFDHQVGSQAGQPAPASLTTPTTVSFDSVLDVEMLLEMLTKPSSVRNAVVLSEILRRPELD